MSVNLKTTVPIGLVVAIAPAIGSWYVSDYRCNKIEEREKAREVIIKEAYDRSIRSEGRIGYLELSAEETQQQIKSLWATKRNR